MQLSPSADLSTIIRHYLCLHTGAKTMRVFPNGNPGLVITKERVLTTSIDGVKTLLPECFLYGQLNTYRDVHFRTGIAILVVVLQPDAIMKLFRLSAASMRDAIMPLNQLPGFARDYLQLAVKGKGDLQSKIGVIEMFVRDHLDDRPDVSQVLQKALELIWRTGGSILVAQLGRELGCSERTLERIFCDTVGITPKRFIGLTRLQAFLKTMRSNPNEFNLAELSHASGYYDQAHLIHDFKKYTGMTPSRYILSHPVALNFTAL